MELYWLICLCINTLLNYYNNRWLELFKSFTKHFSNKLIIYRQKCVLITTDYTVITSVVSLIDHFSFYFIYCFYKKKSSFSKKVAKKVIRTFFNATVKIKLLQQLILTTETIARFSSFIQNVMLNLRNDNAKKILNNLASCIPCI